MKILTFVVVVMWLSAILVFIALILDPKASEVLAQETASLITWSFGYKLIATGLIIRLASATLKCRFEAYPWLFIEYVILTTSLCLMYRLLFLVVAVSGRDLIRDGFLFPPRDKFDDPTFQAWCNSLPKQPSTGTLELSGDYRQPWSDQWWTRNYLSSAEYTTYTDTFKRVNMTWRCGYIAEICHRRLEDSSWGDVYFSNVWLIPDLYETRNGNKVAGLTSQVVFVSAPNDPNRSDPTTINAKICHHKLEACRLAGSIAKVVIPSEYPTSHEGHEALLLECYKQVKGSDNDKITLCEREPLIYDHEVARLRSRESERNQVLVALVSIILAMIYGAYCLIDYCVEYIKRVIELSFL